MGNALEEIDASIAIARAYEGLEKFDKSLKIIEHGENLLATVVGESKISLTQRKAALMYHRGKGLKGKGDLVAALKQFKQSLILREELGDKQQIAESLIDLGKYFASKWDTDQALEFFERSLALFEESGNKRDVAWALWNIGSVHCQKGNLNKALESFNQSRILFEKIGDTNGIGRAVFCLSAKHKDKGELDRALKYQQQSLGLFKEVDNKLEIANSLTQIGFIYLAKGELDRALEYYQQSFSLYKEHGKKYQIAWPIVGIGEIYRLKGELDRALKHFEQSLTLHKEAGHKDDIAESLYYISKILHQQGHLDRALEYLDQSLTILEELGQNLLMTGILFELVSVAIDKHSPEYAQHYLKRLEQLNNQEKNRVISQRYRLAKALLLKISPRMRDKARAQEIFQQIVEEEIVNHPLTVIAMLNLCESLLDELKAYGEVSVLHEAKSLAEKLITLAQQQSSSTLTVNALVLQAKFALIEGNLSAAENILEKAIVSAENKGLGFLAQKSVTERQNLENQYDIWQRLIQNNVPFRERVKQAQIKDYIKEALRLARTGSDHKSCE